jgi:hypothetical protein
MVAGGGDSSSLRAFDAVGEPLNLRLREKVGSALIHQCAGADQGSGKPGAICRDMAQQPRFITRYALGKNTVELAHIFEAMLRADKGDELSLRALRSQRYDEETFDFLIWRANIYPEEEIAKLMFRLGLWHPADRSAGDLE